MKLVLDGFTALLMTNVGVLVQKPPLIAPCTQNETVSIDHHIPC
jgi:hypothetical protein